MEEKERGRGNEEGWRKGKEGTEGERKREKGKEERTVMLMRRQILTE